MKSKHLMIGAIVLAFVAVAAFAFRPASDGGVRNVDAAGAQAAISAGAQVIDVRTAGEFQMGHIEGAVNVPLDQFEAAAQGWDKNSSYVVYCATGARSTSAVETMKALGFKNVAHLAAGVQSWTGELQQGSATGSTKVETSGKPVFIEFFTDA